MSQQITLDQVAFTSDSIQNTLEMVFISITLGSNDARRCLKPKEFDGRT